jgi:hypothetical protein
LIPSFQKAKGRISIQNVLSSNGDESANSFLNSVLGLNCLFEPTQVGDGSANKFYGKLQDIFFEMNRKIVRQSWPQERLLGGSCGHQTNGYTQVNRLIGFFPLLGILGKEALPNRLLALGILFQGLDTKEGGHQDSLERFVRFFVKSDQIKPLCIGMGIDSICPFAGKDITAKLRISTKDEELSD